MPQQCPVCGSERVIPGVRIVDDQGNSTTDLRVVVYQSPGSLLFKGRVYGALRADVCGNCGHAELRADNHEALYDAYQAAKGTGWQPPSTTQPGDREDDGWRCERCGNRVPHDYAVCWSCGAAAKHNNDA